MTIVLVTNVLRSCARRIQLRACDRLASSCCTSFQDQELSDELKQSIEKHWKSRVQSSTFDDQKPDSKCYVLSMFPYPSGNLHMGHVRVYTISDAMARFYRLNGKNVLHPMGWDAFGLPAENAAIQRNISADVWTTKNINHMKGQLEALGCAFDWNREIATCSPEYYRWTQVLFLKLFEKGLAYQKEALVNWDPVDKTVLADEQVDKNGCSWRSGAKVEKKVLKQWFIRTTRFAKDLYDGLDEVTLEDWKDITKLQRHWLGECNGQSFELKLHNTDNMSGAGIDTITVWTANPEHLLSAAFIAVSKNNILTRFFDGPLSLAAINPFTDQSLPIICTDDIEYPADCDVCLGVPEENESHRAIADAYGIGWSESSYSAEEAEKLAAEVTERAQLLNIGGHAVSSKLRDWLISRQRFWGTPIPIVHCPSCGAVPIAESDLPVCLPKTDGDTRPGPLIENKGWLTTSCPSCGRADASRETDTMDTFVDSAWYYLRFIDPKNTSAMFDVKQVNQNMPVDLYIGGKEHAVLHLYYARFISHFLNNVGLCVHKEPFRRLLVQGMVMGRSYRLKGSGKYLTENEVNVIDAKKNKATEKSTGAPVVMAWEKMSKSKLNGVDPAEVIGEHGCDSMRLIMLGDVAPMSHRNWSTATFPGILNWQKRIWRTLHEFNEARRSVVDVKEAPEEDDRKLFDARNYYIKGATFHYKHSHQLSVAISKMQGLTNSIRRATPEVIAHGKQYERAIAAQIIMLAPMAPHFASELWSKFCDVPNRRNSANSDDMNWNGDVFDQRWPYVDASYKLDLTVKINGAEKCVMKFSRATLDQMTHQEAMDIAFNQEIVISYVVDRKIKHTNFILYRGCEAFLNIFLDRPSQKKLAVPSQ